MNKTSLKFLTIGSAVMTLCLGVPFMAQARSSYDTEDNRYRSENTQRGWYDSNRGHENFRDRNSHERSFQDAENVTDQYGDLDTEQDQEKDYSRNRTAGYWTDEGYRSTASTSAPRFGNELRRSDETLRRSIINELGSDFGNVRVDVRNGVATLTGTVEDRDEMVSAVENAYEVGAHKVINRMQIFRLNDRPWENLSDRSLARTVRKELSWSPYVDSDPIRVSVREGVVTLQGAVEDRDEMASAVENAYEAGARRVNNQLRIVN